MCLGLGACLVIYRCLFDDVVLYVSSVVLYLTGYIDSVIVFRFVFAFFCYMFVICYRLLLLFTF